jgi:hypothetical protein
MIRNPKQHFMASINAVFGGFFRDLHCKYNLNNKKSTNLKTIMYFKKYLTSKEQNSASTAKILLKKKNRQKFFNPLQNGKIVKRNVLNNIISFITHNSICFLSKPENLRLYQLGSRFSCFSLETLNFGKTYFILDLTKFTNKTRVSFL